MSFKTVPTQLFLKSSQYLGLPSNTFMDLFNPTTSTSNLANQYLIKLITSLNEHEYTE